MRAVPTPRKSKSRFVRRKAGQLYQVVSCRKIRRKYNLHHLHQLHRKNTRYSRQQQEHLNALTTPLTLEDFINLSSGPESPTAKHKPLLIASFPNGCARSPRVKLLQKNIFSKLRISRRRYRLRNYNPGLVKFHAQDPPSVDEDCFRSSRLIKRQASKYADVKFNFERQNVVKTICIPFENLEGHGPRFLEFDPERSIRLDDFPSLRFAGNAIHDDKRPQLTQLEAGPGIFSLMKRKVKLKVEQLQWCVSERMPRISFLEYPDVIIMSKVSLPNDSGPNLGDAGVQTLQEKLNALVEASRLAGVTLNSYTRMLQKLETVSPSTTRTLRLAVARHIVK
ncbi:LANO_0H16358g1_1 [Lachancea nothofagi CBS 11611]|uniref:LANO_0H16358g1_1 n=1 Tax=Lachancea nothofagi CBS 11611 TaxID=1266666 RepID=A0A1G4KMS4_9SACH|nr:LANO_0H16358g1_1 [Lachancea nothofagi CBS 11611]